MNNATLTYEVEFTRNLGNFENVKPRFGLTVETEFSDNNDLDALKDILTEKVDKWLTDKVSELEAELKDLGLGKQ